MRRVILFVLAVVLLLFTITLLATRAAGQSVTITAQQDSIYRLFGTYRTAAGSIVSNRTLLWGVTGPCTVSPVPRTLYSRYVHVRGTGEGDCVIRASATVSGRVYRDSTVVASRSKTLFVISKTAFVPPPPPPPSLLKAIASASCVGPVCSFDGRASIGATVWEWSWLDGTIIGTGSVFTYTSSSGGTHYRRLTVKNAAGQRDTVTIGYVPVPPDTTLQVSAAIIYPKTVPVLAQGASVQFCQFLRFKDGAIAMRMQDAPGCAAPYAALLPKLPSGAQQTYTDRQCWTWTATGGTITATPEVCP